MWKKKLMERLLLILPIAGAAWGGGYMVGKHDADRWYAKHPIREQVLSFTDTSGNSGIIVRGKMYYELIKETMLGGDTAQRCVCYGASTAATSIQLMESFPSNEVKPEIPKNPNTRH